MGLFDAIFGTAGNLIGQVMNYNYMKGLQNNQYKLNIKGLKESPSASRLGLERAGYNPILGVGSGMTNASVSPANAPSTSDLGTDAVNAYQQGKLIDKQLEEKEALINKTNAEKNQIEQMTENLGNTPFNALGNFLKGITGHSGESSVNFAQSIGDAVRKFGINKIQALQNKLNFVTESPMNPSFDIGISNSNDGWIKGISNKSNQFVTNAKQGIKNTLNGIDLSFSPEEQKIINFVLKQSNKNKYYSKPPKELPK